jgi:hypothetical protein
MNTEPEVCYERVIKRGRKGETIPLEYLQDCHKYHEEWLQRETNKIVNPDDEKLQEIFGKNIESLKRPEGPRVGEANFSNSTLEVKKLISYASVPVNDKLVRVPIDDPLVKAA